jgi:hypothetical protein
LIWGKFGIWATGFIGDVMNIWAMG